jgi:predicted cobalt transporter CbtA
VWRRLFLLHVERQLVVLVLLGVLLILFVLCAPALAQTTPPSPPSSPTPVVLSAQQVEVFTATMRVFSLLLGLIAGLLAGDF